MEHLIKNIHDSDAFGKIIEIGAGMPVTQQLMSIEGASKTIYEAFSPYNKDASYPYTANGKHRTISKEFISNILDIESRTYPDLNLVFASSFQISYDACSHGWIGVCYKEKKYFFHITLDRWGTRELKINFLGNIGINILNSVINGTLYYNAHIDIIDGDNCGLEYMIKNLMGNSERCYIINPDGIGARFEDYFRDQKDVMIYKGSFNPRPHRGHLEVSRRAKEEYPETKILYSLSVTVRNKSDNDSKEIARRVKEINKIGYPVILFYDGLYENNNKIIRQRGYTEYIKYIVGMDTASRIIDDYKNIESNSNFEKVQFLCYDRHDETLEKESDMFIKLLGEQVHISNTEIREQSL